MLSWQGFTRIIKPSSWLCTGDIPTLKITLPLFSPKCFLLLTKLTSGSQGKEKKRKNPNGQIKLAISRHQPGHGSDAPLLVYRETLTLRNQETSSCHVHPEWVSPPHTATALGLQDHWAARGWWRDWTLHISSVQRQFINCLRTCPGQVWFYFQSCVMTADDICPRLAAHIDEYCKWPVSICTATCLLSAPGCW